jgi:hypothetical protein
MICIYEKKAVTLQAELEFVFHKTRNRSILSIINTNKWNRKNAFTLSATVRPKVMPRCGSNWVAKVPTAPR